MFQLPRALASVTNPSLRISARNTTPPCIHYPSNSHSIPITLPQGTIKIVLCSYQTNPSIV